MSTTAGVNERLAALTAAGVSVWLDLLRRSLIENGELQRMIEEESLRGVTSNPAIFEKAILGSEDYDDQLERLAREGASGRDTYRALVVQDVQGAADVLRGVWESTDHKDGYVSLEVEPDLAHDTEGTIAAARLYWGMVDRPNLMIKIPGTEAGVPAIEQAIYEGINVNVTLLFAVEAYAEVAEAYARGHSRDPAADQRGHQRQRDAAVRAPRTRRSRGPTSRGWRPASRAAARSSASRASRASSSAASTRRSTT